MSSEHIAWQVELAINPTAMDDFQALTAEMVEFTRQEHGVLCYERFISADGKTVHVYERYADSAAATAHLLAFGQKFGQRFADLVQRKSFVVYGMPSNELSSLLDNFAAVYLKPFAGFNTI